MYHSPLPYRPYDINVIRTWLISEYKGEPVPEILPMKVHKNKTKTYRKGGEESS